MTEPQKRPPLPWTTPCKGTINLMAVPPPSPPADCLVSSSDSNLGIGNNRVWVIVKTWKLELRTRMQDNIGLFEIRRRLRRGRKKRKRSDDWKRRKCEGWVWPIMDLQSDFCMCVCVRRCFSETIMQCGFSRWDFLAMSSVFAQLCISVYHFSPPYLPLILASQNPAFSNCYQLLSKFPIAMPSYLLSFNFLSKSLFVFLLRSASFFVRIESYNQINKNAKN